MRSFLITGAANGVALWVAAAIVPGVDVEADSTAKALVTLFVLGLILAAVNAVVKPVLKVLAFPLYLLTLGFMALIVNAAMLELTSKLADTLDLGLRIGDFFWSAILAAVVVAIVTSVINTVVRDDD
ncbi:MAG: phage holin family protein [Kineosporiaceae bacterium]